MASCINDSVLMSWRTSVFHVSTLTYGVYELGKNPVNHGLACCLSVEFYVYVLGSHIGEKEKNCGLLIKRTTGTIGMKRRFDKDRNFTSLNICKKMVTRLCQNVFMKFTLGCTSQIRSVNCLHWLKIPEWLNGTDDIVQWGTCCFADQHAILGWTNQTNSFTT